MIPQDLEDLLKTATNEFSDEDSIQELVDIAVAKLKTEGRPFVVTNIFTHNLMWVDQKVKVLDFMGEPKVIVVKNKLFESNYRLDVEFYYPNEVKEF